MVEICSLGIDVLLYGSVTVLNTRSGAKVAGRAPATSTLYWHLSA
jgi:hypothetical protein